VLGDLGSFQNKGKEKGKKLITKHETSQGVMQCFLLCGSVAQGSSSDLNCTS